MQYSTPLYSTLNCHGVVMAEQTFCLLSMPTLASSVSPRASTRMDSAHFAASTRLIFPLYLGGACPIRLAW